MVQSKLLMTTEQIEIIAAFKKIDSIYGISNVKKKIEKADGKYYKNNCIYSEIISMLSKEWLIYKRKEGKQYIDISEIISDIFENIKNATSVIVINSFLKRKSSICCYINGSSITLMESFEGDKKIRIFKVNKEEFFNYLCEGSYILLSSGTEYIKNNIHIKALAEQLPQQIISEITFMTSCENEARYVIIYKNGEKVIIDKVTKKEEEYSLQRIKKLIRENVGWRYRNDK